MSRTDFAEAFRASLIKNEYRTNSIGYYVKWQLVEIWLTPINLLGWTKDQLREICKKSPELYIQWWKSHLDEKSPLAFGDHPIIIQDLVDAVRKTLFETLELRFSGSYGNSQIRSLCSEYAKKV